MIENRCKHYIASVVCDLTTTITDELIIELLHAALVLKAMDGIEQYHRFLWDKRDRYSHYLSCIYFIRCSHPRLLSHKNIVNYMGSSDIRTDTIAW